MSNCCDYGCNQSLHCPAHIEECHVACSAPSQGRQGFAPGVIDGPYRRHRQWLTSDRAAEIGRAVLVIVFLASASATLGLYLGFYNPMGWFR